MRWSKEDLDFLINNFRTLDKSKIIFKLNRNWGAINRKAYKLKLIRGLTLIERFYLKIIIQENGCWDWNSTLDKDGYGQFSIEPNSYIRAHKWSYEYFKKTKILDKLVCHHKCYNRKCVNPDHLEIRTSKDNILDKDSSCLALLNKNKKYCVNNHLLEGDNIYIPPKEPNKRKCRCCKREYKRHWRQKRRELGLLCLVYR